MLTISPFKGEDKKSQKEDLLIVEKEAPKVDEYSELIEALVLISMVTEKLAKKVIKLNQSRKEEAKDE